MSKYNAQVLPPQPALMHALFFHILLWRLRSKKLAQSSIVLKGPPCHGLYWEALPKRDTVQYLFQVSPRVKILLVKVYERVGKSLVVTPCYALLLLVNPFYPLLPLVTPCYAFLPPVTLLTPCYPFLTLVTPCYPCYPLLPLVTPCYPF